MSTRYGSCPVSGHVKLMRAAEATNEPCLGATALGVPAVDWLWLSADGDGMGWEVQRMMGRFYCEEGGESAAA